MERIGQRLDGAAWPALHHEASNSTRKIEAFMEEISNGRHTITAGSEGTEEDVEIAAEETDWPGQQDKHKEPDDREQPVSSSHYLHEW